MEGGYDGYVRWGGHKHGLSIFAEIDRGEVWNNVQTKNSLVSLGKFTQKGATKLIAIGSCDGWGNY